MSDEKKAIGRDGTPEELKRVQLGMKIVADALHMLGFKEGEAFNAYGRLVCLMAGTIAEQYSKEEFLADMSKIYDEEQQVIADVRAQQAADKAEKETSNVD